MVAKEVLNAKRPVPIAFGDFPAIPVGIPTQKLSLSLGGAGNHLNEPTKDRTLLGSEWTWDMGASVKAASWRAET